MANNAKNSTPRRGIANNTDIAKNRGNLSEERVASELVRIAEALVGAGGLIKDMKKAIEGINQFGQNIDSVINLIEYRFSRDGDKSFTGEPYMDDKQRKEVMKVLSFLRLLSSDAAKISKKAKEIEKDVADIDPIMKFN